MEEEREIIKLLPVTFVNCRETVECKISTTISYMINQNFGGTVNSREITENAELLGIIRSDICSNICTHPKVTKAILVPDSRDLLFKYLMQLEYLETRVPLLKDCFEFKWKEAYQKSTVVADESIAFERANVAFNLGSLFSQAACDLHKKTEEDGFKKIAHFCQLAAGSFLSIKSFYTPSSDLKCVDLSSHSLDFYGKLCLAQAQECFMEKAVLEKKKPGSIFKISNHAFKLYSACVEIFTTTVASFKSYLPKNIVSLVTTKKSYLKAFTEFFGAIHDESEGSVGIAIARLMLAESELKEALKYASGFGEELVEAVKHLQVSVSEKLANFNKGNDMVFHQGVADVNSLRELPVFAISKEMTMKDFLLSGTSKDSFDEIVGQDLFSSIVPLDVLESASKYSEEKAKIFRDLESQVKESDGDVSSALETSNANQLISKINNRSYGPCEQVKENHRLVIEKERHSPLLSLGNELESFAGKSATILDETSNTLDIEQVESHNFTKASPQYPEYKSQALFMDTALSYINELKSLRSLMEQTQGSNLIVKSKLVENKSLFEDLTASSLPYPQPNLMDSPYEGLDVGQLELLIKQLKDLKDARSEIIKNLKTLIKDDDINDQLVRNKDRVTEIIAKELEKFTIFKDQIKGNVEQHVKALGDFSDLLSRIFECVEQDESEMKRKKLDSLYAKGFDVYFEVRSNLENGVAFYEKLFSRIQVFSVSVKRFHEARRSEREALTVEWRETKSRLDQQVLKEQLKAYERKSSQSSSGGGARDSWASVSAAASPTVMKSYTPLTPTASSPYGGGPMDNGLIPNNSNYGNFSGSVYNQSGNNLYANAPPPSASPSQFMPYPMAGYGMHPQMMPPQMGQPQPPAMIPPQMGQPQFYYPQNQTQPPPFMPGQPYPQPPPQFYGSNPPQQYQQPPLPSYPNRQSDPSKPPIPPKPQKFQ